jgi:hypothetical protein
MMPSLLKYFTIVGGVLLLLLLAANSVLAPGGPGPTLVRADAPRGAVKHDPQATKVERLRAEEAAAEKAKAEAAAQAAAQAEAATVVTEPPMPARPVQAAAPAPVSAPAVLATDPEGEAARAKRLAQEKVKAEKAKARQARLARERARAKAVQEASAQQVPLPPQTYGYAPRPDYGPFGQSGGWGGGGWNRW